MKRALARLLAPLRSLGSLAAAQPRPFAAILLLLIFSGCAVAGAAILAGIGTALIVGAICALLLAALAGLE